MKRACGTIFMAIKPYAIVGAFFLLCLQNKVCAKKRVEKKNVAIKIPHNVCMIGKSSERSEII